MRLNKFIILNYKSARNVTIELTDDNPVTLIGVNDCGKSTILSGFRLFFDESAKVYFDSDNTKKRTLSNTPLSREDFDGIFIKNMLPPPDSYDKNQVCVLGEFSIDEADRSNALDSSSLHAQYLFGSKNPGDNIYVMRLLSSSGLTDRYLILTEDYLDDGKPSELWNKKATDIIATQKQHNISNAAVVNQNNSGKPTNIERLLAIYSQLTTTPTWAPFDFRKNRSLFPAYRYLDWNISAEELNQLTSEVISPIVNQSLESISADVNTKKVKINEQANQSLSDLYDKYKSSLPTSITGITANVDIKVMHTVTELFVSKSTSDKIVHIDEQGDGIRRQIWLGLIKARADKESANDSAKRYIWCFDEPETHLHPTAQRSLADALSKMASGAFQVIVSTHSTLFVDRTSLNDINQVSLEGGYTKIETTSNTDDIFSNLGVKNSDFLFFDRFIAVEGQTEYYILDHMYRLIYGQSLHSDGIQLLNLCGKDNSSNCIALIDDIFKDFRKPEGSVVYLFDRDSGRVASDTIFLAGSVADFGDELSNEVWVNLLKNICNIDITDTELDAMRSRIQIDNAQSKLHKSLTDYVNQKSSNTVRIPKKGNMLASALRKTILTQADVPASIERLFEKARQV